MCSMSNEEEKVRCFKYGCRRSAVTWERWESAGVYEVSGLCRRSEHAQRPDRPGTLENPTVVKGRAS